LPQVRIGMPHLKTVLAQEFEYHSSKHLEVLI